MLKYLLCLCLAVWLAAASEMIQETVKFRIDNGSYYEKTIHTQAHDIIFIPRQGYADRTVVIHDYNRELSAYKDLTVGKCFITPFYRDVLTFKAILFHFDKESKRLPGQVVKMTPQRAISDIHEFAGEDIADLCEDLPAFWTVKDKTSNRIKRDAHVSACGSVSVGKGGISVSGSVSGGSKSSSARAGSDSGGGVSCSACGSVGVGRGGVSASGSVSASNGKTSARSNSDSSGSSSSSSGSGGRGWKRR